MKNLSSSLPARITPATFLLTAIVALTLLLGSAQLSVAGSLTPTAPPTPTPITEPTPQVTVQIWSGTATIDTGNCNSPSTSPAGLCQGTSTQTGQTSPTPAPSPCVPDSASTVALPTPNPTPSPCNGGAGPNPDYIHATVTLCELAAVPTLSTPTPIPTVSPNPIGPITTTTALGGWLGMIGTKPPRQTGTLTGYGTGSGFRPGATYISLVYQNPTTSTCSRFPKTTPPTPPTLQNLALADSDFASMFLGFWQVDCNGNGILHVDKQATAIGLNNYTTVSVRETQPPNVWCYNCGNDPAPQFNALRACGALTVVPATSCPIPQVPGP